MRESRSPPSVLQSLQHMNMFPIKFFIVLTCLLAIFIQNTQPASLTAVEQKKYKHFIEGQGLYSSSDDVVILTVHNFKREIMGAPHAWLVEFYNSWCGFCQRFAPSWKALGTDVKGWQDMVKIGVLDCSDDDNSPICREYEIMAYPTLRYFHEGYQPGPKNFGLEVRKGDDVEAHRHSLVETIIREQQVENRGMMYPNLRPYTHSALANLFDDLPMSVQYVLLVIEQPDALIGEDVALDLSKIHSTVVRVAHSNNTALINHAGVTVIPSLVAVDRNNNFQVLSGFNSRESLDKMIKEFLLSKNIPVGNVGSSDKDIFKGKWLDAEVPDMSSLMQERAKQALKERIKKMGDVVFQMDLETALRFSLKEISMSKTITGEKLTALRDYITVLAKYFPFGYGGHVFLGDLKDAIDASTEVSGASIDVIVQRAEAETSQVFSSPRQWLGCKGSNPTYRGYPCGLWKLFHYLTINAAEPTTAHKGDADAREVLLAMHGYIKNFFGCTHCSRHFQEMASKLDMHNVSSHDGSILWLWMAHNQVNKRLAGDATEDPEYPKYQFPSAERCPACKNKNDTWNFTEVLKYMKHMYAAINVRYIGSDTRILHMGLEGDANATGRASETSSVFKALDMSMCFILYVSCFALLAVLIRIFLKRGYRKKPYVHDLLGKV